MSLILNIDTAVQTASVCLANKNVFLATKINPVQNDSAAWLQPAIAILIKEQGLVLNDIDAVAVSAGPGSYTGLRVGMASAKGVCYALQKPLLLVNTLQMMAAGALNDDEQLLCPMIDARRMEVFTAIYKNDLTELVAPHNCILSDNSFAELIELQKVVFFGNGSEKFKGLISHPNAIFKQIEATAEQMVLLSYRSFLKQEFADLAYSEPSYGKEFYSPAFKKMAHI